MLDRNDLQYLAEMEDRILREAAHSTQVIIENTVDKKLNLILEALAAQQEQMKQFATRAEHDELDVDLRMMKSVLRTHTRQLSEQAQAIDELKKKLA